MHLTRLTPSASPTPRFGGMANILAAIGVPGRNRGALPPNLSAEKREKLRTFLQVWDKTYQGVAGVSQDVTGRQVLIDLEISRKKTLRDQNFGSVSGFFKFLLKSVTPGVEVPSYMAVQMRKNEASFRADQFLEQYSIAQRGNVLKALWDMKAKGIIGVDPKAQDISGNTELVVGETYPFVEKKLTDVPAEIREWSKQ